MILSEREGKSSAPMELRLGRMFHALATGQRREAEPSTHAAKSGRPGAIHGTGALRCGADLAPVRHAGTCVDRDDQPLSARPTEKFSGDYLVR